MFYIYFKSGERAGRGGVAGMFTIMTASYLILSHYPLLHYNVECFLTSTAFAVSVSILCWIISILFPALFFQRTILNYCLAWGIALKFLRASPPLLCVLHFALSLNKFRLSHGSMKFSAIIYGVVFERETFIYKIPRIEMF